MSKAEVGGFPSILARKQRNSPSFLAETDKQIGLISLWLTGCEFFWLQGTAEKSRRRQRRGRSGRAATTAAAAPSRSRRSASAWTRRAAGATRRAGAASSLPSASTRPSTSAWTASRTSASGAATPSRPDRPTGQLTHLVTCLPVLN
jgi:hypothetical protein